MFGNNPFNLPLPQGVLKTLGAESKVFEQQGQQGGQGGQGYGPCEDQIPSNNDISTKYSDSANEYYLFQIDNGWGDEVQIVEWSGSTPSEAIKRQYLSYLRYTNRVNRNALQGGCVPQMQSNYANPGFVVLYPTTGLWGDKSVRNSNTGVRIFEEVWENAKAQHEGAFAGCTESTASNYNPNAASDNGSCVWAWEENTNNWNWGGRPQTNLTTDGFRYKWEMTRVDEKLGYTQDAKRLRGNWRIYKECFDKGDCGVPSTAQAADRTLPITTVQTGQIGFPNGLPWDDFITAKANAKTAGQTAINTLFSNHVAVECRDSAPYDTIWGQGTGIPQPCDGAFALVIKRRVIFCDSGQQKWKRAIFTLEKDGVVVGSWTVLNNADYSLQLGGKSDVNAMWQQHMGNQGNYSWTQMAQDLSDAHDASLATTTRSEDYNINNGWRRVEIPASKVTDGKDYNFFLPWATRILTTNACGTKRSQGNSYISSYRFRETGGLLNTKPSVTKTSDGKLEVKYDGEILTPFETFTTTGLSKAQEDALTEPYYAKIGCMDASATNYDSQANTNYKPGGSSSACIWDCTEDDGRGLMPNCRTCLPDADKNPVDMVFDVSTNTWSCPATGSGGGDPPLVEEPSILDSEWLPFAAIGGLILLALGMG